MIRTAALLGSLVFTAVAVAAPPAHGCGTSRLGHLEEAYLHQRAQTALAGDRTLTVAVPAPLARDAGNIALLDGGGGVIAPPNPFPLSGRTLRWTPAPGGYILSLHDNERSAPLAAAAPALEGLGDDDARAVPLPFPFAFFGARYREAYVHSDGNLTFREPDAGAAARSLGRLAAGPPRLAPAFADLDPSRPGAAVRVLATPRFIAIAWVDVPEFTTGFLSRRQTLELVLHASGVIDFVYYAVNLTQHVTGLTPGNLASPPRVVPLAESAGERFDTTVAEPFTSVPRLDSLRLAQRFYETHPDSFDYLVVFNTAGLAAASGAVATQVTVRSFTHGIGDILVDEGRRYGSPRRLQAFLNMGPLSQYPANPRAPIPGRGAVTGDSALSLLAHEAGHLFLALASIRVPGAPSLRPMLGAGLTHWSFNFNSDASVMEGNRIEDAGPAAPGATRFLTSGAVEHFSALDQYLMGLRGAWETPPSFLVTSSPIPANRLPQTGIRFSGGRLDVHVTDLIDAEGPRAPSDELAQRRFRFAFLLVSNPGHLATEAEIAQVEAYREAFEPYFHEITGRRAWADTSLNGALHLSAWPMAGLLNGATTEVRLARPGPPGEPLAAGIHTTNGLLEAPADVRFGRRQAEAAFRLTARAPGYADLIAEPRSGTAAPAFARIKVAASPVDVELRLHYRDGPLVFVRATDWEDVSYAGVPLDVRGARCVAPANCTTGADGLLQLHAPRAAEVSIPGNPAPPLRLDP